MAEWYRYKVYAARLSSLSPHFPSVLKDNATGKFYAISEVFTKQEAIDMVRSWKRKGYTAAVQEYQPWISTS